MANIPYKFDSTDTFGPTGKTPWISINGEHYYDSELIIQFLSKKFEKNLNKLYSEEKLAIGTATRLMMEEHVFWGIARALFVDEVRCEATKDMVLPFPRSLILFIVRLMYIVYLWAQGIGRLSPDETYVLMQKDIKAVADILGKNKFLLGDEPSVVDASVFGFLAQMAWGSGGSIPKCSSLLQEHPNLMEYSNRMKTKFWPDWDQCLARKS